MRIQITARCMNNNCQFGNLPELLELPAVNELGTMFALPPLYCGSCRSQLSVEWNKDDTFGQLLTPHVD